MCCRLALARVTPKSTQNYTPSRTSCTRSSTASSTRVSSTSAWDRWPPGSNPHRGLPVTHAGEGHEFGYGSVLRGATFKTWQSPTTVSYTHLRAHETGRNLVCRLLL